jgi:prolyl-tRNA editing enzyme YbaK/EbsC (Cys-tRNA(Pro) deacylase)
MSAEQPAEADLHANARRVRAAAEQAGLAIEVVEYPDGTRTAEQAAAAVGCHVGQIVKSLIFDAEGRVVLALTSGANRVDLDALAALVGVASLGRADADQVRAATGFPIGGVPPVGNATAVPTFMDPDLFAHDAVWAAAGTPRHVFSVDPRALADATGAVVAPFAAR